MDPLDEALSLWLPDELLEEGLELPGGELLDEELLELDEELLELDEELLELDEELLEEGEDGLELGVEGVCGVVGLLALGQPLSSRQAQASPASCNAGRDFPLINNVGFDNVFRLYWLARLKTGPKSHLTHFPHQAVRTAYIDFIFVNPVQAEYLASFGDGEF